MTLLREVQLVIALAEDAHQNGSMTMMIIVEVDCVTVAALEAQCIPIVVQALQDLVLVLGVL